MIDALVPSVVNYALISIGIWANYSVLSSLYNKIKWYNEDLMWREELRKIEETPITTDKAVTITKEEIKTDVR